MHHVSYILSLDKNARPRIPFLWVSYYVSRLLTSPCNNFTPQIKGSFCSLNVMYHNHSSLGVLQLPWCATTYHWNAYNYATTSTGML